jgi:hypothetical protein
MFRTRPWVILLIALILALVVQVYGKCLLSTAWGSIGLNVISDFYFVVFLTVIFGLLYRQLIANARNFFGIGDQVPIQVYISAHKDQTTVTEGVLTAKEYETADELRSNLKKGFPGAMASWAKLFGIDLEVPEIVIRGSPLEKVKEWPYAGSLILIGGPTRNALTEFYFEARDPWLTFDDSKKKFLVHRKGQTQKEELDNSGNLAVLEKLIVDGRVVIITFGFGESQTCAAVRHLANEWQRLAKNHPNKEFARLLRVDGQGQVHVLEEFA